MSHLLQELEQQIDSLSPKEIGTILLYAQGKLAQNSLSQVKSKWKDVCGIAPDLLKGEDAQEWVSKMRE
jgi:hypothetical protein